MQSKQIGFIHTFHKKLFNKSSFAQPTSISLEHTNKNFVSFNKIQKSSVYATMAEENTTTKVETSDTIIPASITFIGGGGSIGTSLIKGLISCGKVDANNIIATSRRESSLEHLPIPSKNQLTNNRQGVELSDIVVLCVKPYFARDVLNSLAGFIKPNQLLISVVAGITTSEIEKLVPGPGVIRAMPNPAATVCASTTSICAGKSAENNEIETAKIILESIGAVHIVSEEMFAPALAITGCSMAFVCTFAEALVDETVKMGIDRNMALEMTSEMIRGSGEMLLKKKQHPAVLRNELESPGGITIAGSVQLEKDGFRAAVQNALEKCVKRAREMGEK